MTIINNIEIDNIKYKENEIKTAILNNDPIEDKLNVIIVISNPCLFARRYILAKEFINRMENEETYVNLYVVELCYGDQRFLITDSKNKNHLQLRTIHPLWHKENMINIGIQKLLPSNWKAVAWIDADIEFESTTWALDTLKILNGSKDIVQIWSQSVDMNYDESTIQIRHSFGFQYCKKKKYNSSVVDYWHPGYGWACTRKAYDRMKGLYDTAILGSGDYIMAMALLGVATTTPHYFNNYSDKYQNDVKNLRLGYVPGTIIHHFHGFKKNRKYAERNQILRNYAFDPVIHITKNNDGIIVPTDECPKELLKDIISYFKERNEDEKYNNNNNNCNDKYST